MCVGVHVYVGAYVGRMTAWVTSRDLATLQDLSLSPLG